MVDRQSLEELVREAVRNRKSDRHRDPESAGGTGASANRRRGSTVATPRDRTALSSLRHATPARIGVGQVGRRYRTEEWLKFRADHARAVDAVWEEVSASVVERCGFIELQTRAKDKREYLKRPDLGRRLSATAVETVKSNMGLPPSQRSVNDVLLCVADGLSAAAIETTLPALLPALEKALETEGLAIAYPRYFTRRGRVWIMDHLGDLLEPTIAILLIGERPGLVTSASLSAYIVYEPRLTTREPERSLISNIHEGGHPPADAAKSIARTAREAIDTGCSGVALSSRRNGTKTEKEPRTEGEGGR